MGQLMTERKDLPPGGYFVMPRYLPIAVLMALAVWTAGGIWYAAKLDARVASLEKKAEAMEAASVERLRERDRLTIVEVEVRTIRENQERQNTVLERIERRLSNIPPAP